MIETYTPLYRKYRPQAFADVVGQQPIIQTLGNAINLNKVAHAYLFTGPRGTGKTSTARIFAKSLNCEQGPTVTPCQICASCTGITEGNALDVVEFDAASNNSVDNARELIENCQFSPMAGKYKVYIIDEVHMLSSSAFNALLKTLEEPPPNVIFIFATTEAHKVLATIVSRCQRFDFSRITTQDIVARLKDVAAQEKITIDEEALFAIARHARGGMRDALGLLDQVSVLSRAEADKVITRQDVLLFIGSLEEEILLNLSQALAEKDSNNLLEQLHALFNRGVEPVQIVKELTHHFRNLLLVKVSGAGSDVTRSAELLDLPQNYFDRLLAQIELYDAEELPQILSRLSYVERNIRHTQQSHLWLEVGLLELAYRTEIHLVEDLSRRVKELENRLSGQPLQPMQSIPKPSPHSVPQLTSPPPPAQQVLAQPAAKPVQQPTPNPIASPVQPQQTTAAVLPQQTAMSGDLSGQYQMMIQSVPSPGVKSMLSDHTQLLSHEGSVLTIVVGSEPILNTLNNPKKLIHLQKTAEQIFGEGVQVNLQLGEVIKSASKPAASMPVSSPAPQQPVEPVSQSVQTLPEQKPEPVVEQVTPPQAQPEQVPQQNPQQNIQPNPPENQSEIQMTPVNPELEAEKLEEAKAYTQQLLQGQSIES